MKKIIRLTESDLTRLVKRTIMEMGRRDYSRNYIEGPYSMGHADYQKNWEKHNKEMEQQSEGRKYHIPSYNPRTGGGWNDESLKEYVYENFGAELPDDINYNPYSVSSWLKENGYERL